MKQSDYSWLTEGLSPIEIQKKNLYMDISFGLIEYREKLGLTKEDLSEKFEIDISLIEDIENLKHDFSLDELCEICYKLKLDTIIILE